LLFGALAWGAFRQSSGALQQLFQQSLAAASLELAVAQLQPLGKAIGGLIGILLFSGLLFSAVSAAGLRRSLQLGALTVVAILGGLTVRTMVMAAFINDELASEYIVYAHTTPDVKEVLDQLEEISWRLTGTPDQIQVAYGKETAWPFYWYMYTRFPNNYYFDTPEAERLLASPVIIAARSEWESVEAITGADYDSYDYRHIWWPVEDYKNLTWEQIRRILTEPDRREAIWDIVWKRDYTRYAKLRNPDDPFTLVTWPHRVEFRFYVRRDLAELIWAYHIEAGEIQIADEGDAVLAGEPVASEVPLQAYEQPAVAITHVLLEGASPRGLAVAPDGSVYVADPSGHLIWHVTLAGDIVDVWGGYGTDPGQFNEPADVAVDADGNVYVADTWNHRVQKFAPDTVGFDGEPLASWGRFAKVTANDAAGWGAFFGPRGIDIGPEGNVYVTDTGNNRVQVFDAQGKFLRVFGIAGDGFGQLREPAGIAVGADGEVYVADSWNHRIQDFHTSGLPMREWGVPVWGNLRLDDRPQLAVTADSVIATDPVYQRILIYDLAGELQYVVRDSTTPPVPSGVDVMADGVVVSDRVLSQLAVYPLDGASESP
jgi:sugar lactone lactonase YvrE